MKLHDATIKFPVKEYEGHYGPYLQTKATLSSGEDVAICENDPHNSSFLSLQRGQKIQLIEDIGKNGKPKYTPVLEGAPESQSVSESSTPITTTTPTPSPSERLEQLLDCFSAILMRVEVKNYFRGRIQHFGVLSVD